MAADGELADWGKAGTAMTSETRRPGRVDVAGTRLEPIGWSCLDRTSTLAWHGMAWHGRAVASADLDELLRWDGAGGTWQLSNSSAESVDVTLLTCGRDEVMGHLSSREHDLIEYVATPEASDV